MGKDTEDAGFAWYKDIALGVSVFVLVVVGLGVLFEAPSSVVRQHLISFLAGIVICVVVCVGLATSRLMVLGGGLAIMFFRSLIAVLFRPAVGPTVFIGAALVSGALLCAIMLSQRWHMPYDPNRSSTLLGVLAAAAGVGWAALLLRVVTIVSSHSWR